MTQEVKEFYKSNMERMYNLKLSELPSNALYEVGKIYFCGYWKKTFKVLESLNTVYGQLVKCQWSDGEINAHSTALTENDFLVIEQEEITLC